MKEERKEKVYLKMVTRKDELGSIHIGWRYFGQGLPEEGLSRPAYYRKFRPDLINEYSHSCSLEDYIKYG